jgi:type VI secretion system protein ImpH
MASHGGRRGPDLIEALWRAPRRFELLAAVRALEAAGARRVRYRAPLEPVFPPGDVEGVAGYADGPVIETAAVSLFGPNGPLPAPLAEAVRRRSRGGEGAARAFFDLFGDRLTRAFVDMLRLERPTAAGRDPARAPQAVALRALAGRADPVAAPAGFDRDLLAAAGLLHERPVSLHGAGRLIEAAFGARARVRGFAGGWTALAQGDRARLSARGGSALGGGAALGRAVWLQEQRLTVEIGPTDAGRLRALLPGGADHARLAALAGHALPPETDLDCRVTVTAAQAPAARLGSGTRLGWTSWLAPRGAAQDGVATFRLRWREAAA